MITSTQTTSVSDFDTVVFVVSGGLGRNLAATAVARNLKRAHPDKKLVVVATHAPAWLGNRNVDILLQAGANPAFYDEYIQQRRSLVLNVEPYQHSDYIYRRKHLIEVWCELAGVECDEIRADLNLFQSEKRLGMGLLKQINKPLMLIQSTGGPPPEKDDDDARFQAEHPMQKRNLPHEVAQAVVNRMQRDYVVAQIRVPTQKPLANTIQLEGTPRELMSLIPHAEKMLFIDSFMQHAAAALGRSATVCWAGASPKCLSYEIHNDLTRNACPTPECHRPNSFLFDRQVNGQPWNCPHEEACCRYDPETIIETLTEGQQQPKAEILIDAEDETSVPGDGTGVERIQVHP